MFVIIFRELVVLLGFCVVAYVVWRVLRVVIAKDTKRKALEEAQASIQATLDAAKNIPDFNKKELEKAREKINNLLKEGKK